MGESATKHLQEKQRKASDLTRRRTPTPPGLEPPVHIVQRLQRSMGNQAVLRTMRSQRAETKHGDRQANFTRETARKGIASAPGPLPHLEAIQRSFGHHDVSGVKAHTGAQAASANQELNSIGYAAGDHVAFAASPDLHTAAHEAAHVVQQQAGVHLSGGVGRAGDEYERHADAVADVVVRGRSAEGMLGIHNPSPARGLPQTTKQPVQFQLAKPKQQSSKQTGGNVKSKKAEATTLPEVTVTAKAPRKSEEVLKDIEVLRGHLSSATSISRAKLIASEIKARFIEFQSAPISPTPKRGFVAGPISFSDPGPTVPYYEFGFETMQDRHWREGWDAVYKLIAELSLGPFAVVIDLCDMVRTSDREEREEKAQDILKDAAVEEITGKGPAFGKYLMREGLPKGLAKNVAILIKALNKAIPYATAAYEVYKANTEGPSAHEAALECTALIMANRYGYFAPTPTTSYCRVRKEGGPFPQEKDRRRAFNLMANRIFERMRNIIALKHIATPEAFYAFRKTQIDNAWNIVAAAGGDLEGRKVTLVTGKEKDLRNMEEMAEFWKKNPVDTSKVFKPTLPAMPSDQFRGIGTTIKQRHGLRD